MSSDVSEVFDISDDECEILGLLESPPRSLAHNGTGNDTATDSRREDPKPAAEISDDDRDDLDNTPLRHYSRSSSYTTSTPVLAREGDKLNIEAVSRNTEARFLEQCLGHAKGGNKPENWIQIDLWDFRIRYSGKSPFKHASLHDVASRNQGVGLSYCFDGRLSHADGSTQEVLSVDIDKVEIDKLGGLGEDLKPMHNSCSDALYLQTRKARVYNCFYRLQTPHEEYRPFYENFVWLANFAKYIIDYLIWASESNKSICLQDFEVDFVKRLQEWHQDQECFQRWHEKCGSATDFRMHLTCADHAEFIFGQAYSIYDDEVAAHPLWEELGRPLKPTIYVKPAPALQTLVTAHAAKCFVQSFPSWGAEGYNLLEIIVVEPIVAEQQAQRRRQLGLGDKFRLSEESHFEKDGRAFISKVALMLESSSLRRSPCAASVAQLIGKALVVLLHRDDCRSRPCTCAATYKFAVGRSSFGGDLRVRWLVLPSQTICAGRHHSKELQHPQSFYPIGNELFWADSCCCATIPLHDIVAFYTISTHADRTKAGDDLFVHRQYLADEAAISTLPDSAVDLCPRHERSTITQLQQSSNLMKGNSEEGANVSLFSGCGLSDYGFIKGSSEVFETVLAVELDEDACLSFRANQGQRGRCEVLHQDVNAVLREIITGKRALRNTACLIAGCPCQGFSHCNMNKTAKDSQKNCSMLAHTLSWIQLICPKMVLIENVTGMDQTKPSAAGQAVSFLVSIGYQVRLVTIRASEYGAATTRDRLFIIATVPGIPLPVIPKATHGDGKHQSPTATVSSVTTDLNVVDNDTLLNPRQPDHVPIKRFEPFMQSIIAKIPRSIPKGYGNMANLASAHSSMSAAERTWFKQRTEEQKHRTKGTLRRIHPNRPYGTITTSVNAMNSRAGGSIHWASDRSITMMELRRTQGVPDHFIVIGSKFKQVKQVGNAVAVPALAMFGKAYAESLKASHRLTGDDPTDIKLNPESGETDNGGHLPWQSKVEEFTDTEDDENLLNSLTSTVEMRKSLAPLKSSPAKKELSLTPSVDVVLDDGDEEMPGINDVLTPTPRSRYRQRNDTVKEDVDLPDLADLMTPTKSHLGILNRTQALERRSIAPKGTFRMWRETKSTVTCRKRRSSFAEDVLKRPRLSSQDTVRVNMPNRTAKHDYSLSGSSKDDAIVLDD